MTQFATSVAHSSILSSESGPLGVVVTGRAGRTYPSRSHHRLAFRDNIALTGIPPSTDTASPLQSISLPFFSPDPTTSAPPPLPPPPLPTSSSAPPPPPSGTTILDSFPPIKASSAPPPPPPPSHSSSPSPSPSSSAPVSSSSRFSQSRVSASSSTDVGTSGNTVLFVPSVALSSTIPSSTSPPTAQGPVDPSTHVPVIVVGTIVPIFLLLLLGSILITLYRRRRRGGPETDNTFAITQWRQHCQDGVGPSVPTADAAPTTPIFLLPPAQEPTLSPRRLHDPEKARLATRDVDEERPVTTGITPTEVQTGTTGETRVRAVSRAPTFRSLGSLAEPLPEYSEHPLPQIPVLHAV
ncbi:hypothetical protein FB45DRAFT_1080476 [Roridomyces roridus]|uniref:Uncharacterized protein n=1 Tax=Roridomyces roridus TaxID=1738132 RepID=A0AAD7FK93_9AGAR|nr:hypothetical protein FB45DRAFT_1080476 [Roridomyces roridus]